ncbi:hypothetical protein N7463_006453 [Penicillium fimorum]|uniref:Uncharacterized protein n=1 Tax=Penicillium fimorum TaxID=1882269 RepID=A0A9W9XUS2_9EURO|nr:hypothetical protein N7463_006453 [Penicillium fimorum]
MPYSFKVDIKSLSRMPFGVSYLELANARGHSLIFAWAYARSVGRSRSCGPHLSNATLLTPVAKSS